MNSKERVLVSLGHQEPDRIPLDYWAVPETTNQLLQHFKLKNRDELLKRLNIDFRYVKPKYRGKKFKEEAGGSLQQNLPDGTYKDIWGVKRRRVNWAKGSYLEVIESPLAEAKTEEEIKNYPWPEVNSFDYPGIFEECEKYENYAIILTGDRLTTRASIFKLAIYLRGMEKFLMDLALNPKLAQALIAKLLEFHLKHNQRILERSVSKIDILMLGDDFGTERGPMMSLEMFRKFFKPGLKELIALGHNYGVKAMLHSCGGVREFIPDLIEIGLDILNPIQTQAKGMEPEELKREFGKDICFHGSVDVQRTLPLGTIEEIKKEVKSRIKILGKNGGFILAPSHNLQPDIPAENIIAMYEAGLGV
ncbi:MAG: hypothetical protein COZ37_00755, partial [bacterium (Candidatus Ratteibacteria) CG_4_10_14_3_um_filter_41_18]